MLQHFGVKETAHFVTQHVVYSRSHVMNSRLCLDPGNDVSHEFVHFPPTREHDGSTPLDPSVPEAAAPSRA